MDRHKVQYIKQVIEDKRIGSDEVLQALIELYEEGIKRPHSGADDHLLALWRNAADKIREVKQSLWS